jgi:rod shape-determining protein MreC
MDNASPRVMRTVIIALAIIGLLALALGGYLAPLSRYTVDPLIGLQRWISNRYVAVYDFLTAPRDVASLRQRNAELEAEVFRLQTQIIELQQQISEVEVLSALLDFARTNPENRYAAASVIGRDPSPFLHYVIIDKGSDNGIRRGMPVVTQQGLIGRIDAVTSGASRVQLITDPASSVNVRLQQTKTEVVLSGSITGDLTLDMIPQDVTVQIGELVITSGLGGSYPQDILIGQVTGVKRQSYDLFQTASIQSIVDFSRLTVVLVITNFKPINVSPLVPTTSP